MKCFAEYSTFSTVPLIKFCELLTVSSVALAAFNLLR